jgi:hypothetical protein
MKMQPILKIFVKKNCFCLCSYNEVTKLKNAYFEKIGYFY